MRRVRPQMRDHKVRCFMDRPHLITHSCSPVHMPDKGLGAMAGISKQAAEVVHSIAVVNRTRLAYMTPEAYVSHRIVQLAFMKLRKLYRMHADNGNGENDHVPLSPFFQKHIQHQCQLASGCASQSARIPVGENVGG